METRGLTKADSITQDSIVADSVIIADTSITKSKWMIPKFVHSAHQPGPVMEIVLQFFFVNSPIICIRWVLDICWLAHPTFGQILKIPRQEIFGNNWRYSRPPSWKSLATISIPWNFPLASDEICDAGTQRPLVVSHFNPRILAATIFLSSRNVWTV